jgi:poly(A) polymerase
MPVITPAYPQMCATFNITRSNKAVIQRELERAGTIADRIMSNAAPWKDLFVKHTFFTKGYKYYLAVIVTSKEKEAHKIWSGFVESKVRVLVATLERHKSISIAHPFNKGFDRVHRANNEEEFEKILDGSLAFITAAEAVDEDEDAIKKDEEEEKKPKVEDGTKSELDSSDVSVPNKSDLEDKEVKMEDVPTSGGKVYTTTHYIGLELAEGKLFHLVLA